MRRNSLLALLESGALIGDLLGLCCNACLAGLQCQLC